MRTVARSGFVWGALLAVAAEVAVGQVYRYPEAELLDAGFTTEPWGSGVLSGRERVAAQGVRMTFVMGNAADGGKTVVGDSWPVSASAGLAWDGGYLPNSPEDPHAQPHSNVSINAWRRLAVRVTHVSGGGTITFRLFMNTGLTGPSAYPANDARNNTAWLSQTIDVGVGESGVAVLDFERAIAMGAADNPWPHSGYGEGWADGTWQVINERDRHEVTNMGFELYGEAGATVVLDLELVPVPPCLTMRVDAFGARHMTFVAEDARDHAIEWSADLATWNRLTVLPCVTGERAFADTTARFARSRYYRAVLAENVTAAVPLHQTWKER